MAVHPLTPPADLSDLTPEQRALLMLRLRRKAAETGEEGPPPIPRVRREGELPLSFAQQRLWFLDRLDPGNPAYNIPGAIRLSGALDVAAFGHAVTEMVRRHEVLRTTFPEAGGEPRQEIAPPPAALPVPRIDLSGLPAARREPAARELALQTARQPFDLGRDTLVRVLLLRLDAEVHVALFNLHHIVADGWSVSIVIREIAGAYAAFAAGRAPELPELPIQYVDFAVWQRGFLAGPELERQLAFWRQTLAGAPPVLELPADRRRPPFQTFRGGRRDVHLPSGLWGEVRAASQRWGATPFMTTLAGFKALLARLTGQEDVVVGSPIANRNRGEIEGLIGLFANTLVLRTDLSAAPSLRQAVGRVREGTLAAYAHQDLPFEEVVKELAGRDLSRNPLFQVMFSLANIPRAELEMEGLALAYEDGYGGTAKFDFDLAALEHGDALFGAVEYNADLFDPTSVDRVLAHWRSLLEAALAEPDRPLAELPLLTAAERHQLVEEWSQAEPVPRLSGTLHGLFAAQAARTPAATAVIAGTDAGTDAGTERLSYGELAGRVRELAGRLSRLGMGPERIVGVRLGRTADLVVTLLAVLESGAAYLPLDPAYPAERLRFLLADTGAALVVTERSLAWPEGVSAEIPTLYVDEAAAVPAPAPVPVPARIAEENLAYLIYTSGSTGVPKGVAIPHGSALRLVEWALARYSPAELAGVLFSTSTSFDMSVFEIFVPLSSGGAVIVADDALALPGLPAAPEVTLVNTVPSALAGLLDLGPLPASVRTVNLGGEPLRGALAERIHRAGVARLWNLYGPSEDTTFSTGSEVAPALPGMPETLREPDIGRPVAGTAAFVLDDSLAPVPAGVPGELYLGGAALARGYFNRPALTAERFGPDPLGSGGSRLYRTGDRARWRPDGTLELLGRMDHQVKVRGFRVELGEIEAVLAAHESVREAAVAAPTDASGDRRLVAYVSAAEGSGPLDVAALGVYLGSRLPSFMVPSLWVELPALPLTRTGKVDRKALPAPGKAAASTIAAAYEAPRTATEEMLAAIWGGLLGRERVGVHDNFFALGGHSLLATQVISRLRERLGVELPVRALFEQPTVAGLAALLAEQDEGVEATGEAPIAALPRDAEGGGTFPASFAQSRLWFLDLLEPGSAVYNMPVGLSLEGELDEARLAAALGELVRRHETLRTTFVQGDEGPLQVVHPATTRPFALATIDLSALGEEERRRELSRRLAAESLRPFDLAGGPLLRATLVRLADRENALLLNLHHVVSDGWSMGVLVREVTALYAAAVSGGRPLHDVLPPLPVQYADFSVWQRRRLSGETLRREIDHWRGKLAGVPPFLELPTDRPRPPVQTFTGRSLPLWIEPGLAGGLAALALGTETTLFMVLLACFEVLLGIWSGAEDLVVGTPIAGRNRVELEALIGFFVNSLVLRGNLSGDPPFAAFLGRVREDTLSGYAHQDLPFEKLVEEVQPERSQAHSPIFQVMFALQNAPMGQGSELPGLTLRSLAGSETAAKYDLTLSLTEAAGEIGGSLEYNVDLFDAPTLVRLLDQYRALLAGVVADPGSRLSELPLLGAAERQQLLREWSVAAPVADGPGAAVPVHELFAAEAARRPDAVALVFGEQVLTYGELASRSSRMARRLAELGVGPGVLVGLCAERSPELVLGVLAILAAGGAYLPLDPAHPMERLAYTLADAGAPVLLAEEYLHERLPSGAARVVGLHELAGEDVAAGEIHPPAVRVDPGDVAYVIYTSGSTGRPKGVEVSHANAARLFAAIRREFAFGPDDVWTLFHSIAFDFSVWELWGALAFGGRLVIVPGDTARSPEAFYELLRRERVTVLSQTPSAFRQLLRAEESALERGEAMAADLRLVAFGGEALDPAALAPWLERHGEERPLLANLYGITETTVHTTWRRLRRSDLARPGSAVGRPLSDVALYLLDGAGRPVPIGVPGEIHVGGAGVARGYLGRPALTAARFVPDPFAGAGAGEGDGGLRLYRSGDLARWRPDGDLEYLRRIDRQVKVRGFRIELGEIEAALAEHPEVREAAVVAREDRPGDVRLVGYVSSAAEPGPAPQALAAFLAERLPDYMVPAAWVLLDRLPLTANGKVDRAALPAPAERGGGGAYVAPRNPVEEVLAGIWEEVLELPRVGVEDDFFALGGHSLVAAQVTSRVLKAFSVELPLRVLFERPTVAGLAAEVERLRSGMMAGTAGVAAAPPLVRASRGDEAPLSFRQEWRWLFDQLSPAETGHNVPLALTLSGAVSVPALAAALAAEVERHESLRTRIVAIGGKPVQRIDPPSRPPLPFVDLGGLPPAVAQGEASRLAAAEWVFPFDVARGPLLRSVLVRLEEEVFVLLLTLHHIISDGWSMRILARELSALYEAARAGRPSPLPDLPIQFGDFAIWQREWLQGETLERLRGAAAKRLAGMPRLDLPIDRPPSARRYFSAGTLPFGLDAGLTASLNALSRRQGASLFMTVLAAFTGLLRRHTGRGDFPVASITAGRTRAEIEPLVGYFTNTLIIRAAAGGDPDFGELLARTRGATLAAYDQQDLPFSLLLDALRAERPGAPPVFEVLFLLQPPLSEVAASGVEVERFPVEANTSQDFTLVLDLAEAGGRLIGTLSYNQALFDSTTALRWRGHLESLLAGAAADPARPLTELPLLSEGERHQVTVEWGAAVRLGSRDGGPAPIGIWGEVAGAPAGRPGRYRADGTVETGAPAAAPAPEGTGKPARSLEALTPAKRKLLARRIRGEAGGGAEAAAPAPRRRSGGAYVAPRSPVEQVLAGIWEEVLGRGRVGVEDDFFALGGHSLLAIQVTSRVLMAFDVDLPLRTLFDHPTVAALAAEVERVRASEAAPGAAAVPPLVRAPGGTEAPLSFRQEWRWLFDQLSPGNTGHNMPFALTLRGAVSAPALAAALAAEVERHESLRTRIVSAGGKPVQRIDPPSRPPLPFVDLGGLPPAVAQGEASRLAAAEWIFPFDVARGPLLRSVLVRLEEEVFVLLVNLHHIIADGWSMRILARELSALYEAAQAGRASPLPELPIQFRDFAIWQREWLQGETLDRLLGDAVRRLAGMPSLDLPTDRPPAAQPYFSSGILPFGLGAALTASLSALSRRHEASLFMTVLAAFTGLLRRHTGRGDFPVASITAGRTRAEIEPLIGYFTNTLIIRAAAAGDPGFGELLAQTRGATLAAYDHQDLPFSLLVEALRAERSGEPPVFEVLFQLQPPLSEVAAAGVEVERFPTEASTSQDFALVLELVEVGGQLIGTLSYNQALFDSTTALRWRGHLEALLAGAAADPERPLTELPLLSEGERHQVTVEWEAAVLLEGGPAPIGIWGEVVGAPAGRTGRFRADGTVETSAPAPAGTPEVSEPVAAPAPGRPTAPEAPGEPPRSLASLSAAKRKLLAKRIRGEAGSGAAPASARREPQLLVDLQPERPAGAAARPPFFCVHAIGGAVLSYRDLARELGGEQPFYGIQAAGLAGGRAVDDLPAMAAQYAAAVEAAAPQGPYLLGGWSFGGVVAFEMARQMRQRGRPVALVALLDSWAPALVPGPAPVREDDLVRLYLHDQAGLQGLDASWLEGEPPGMDEAAALDWLLARAHEHGVIRANLRPEQIRPILDVYSANVRAGGAYRPQPGGGHLTLFRPGNSPEPTNGWSALADEPVEVHEMAADHYFMLAPPAVAGLAERLRSCIERSLAAFGPEARR